MTLFWRWCFLFIYYYCHIAPKVYWVTSFWWKCPNYFFPVINRIVIAEYGMNIVDVDVRASETGDAFYVALGFELSYWSISILVDFPWIWNLLQDGNLKIENWAEIAFHSQGKVLINWWIISDDNTRFLRDSRTVCIFFRCGIMGS